MPPIRPLEKYIPKVRTKQSLQSLKNQSLGALSNLKGKQSSVPFITSEQLLPGLPRQKLK